MVPEAMDDWANNARIEELAGLLAHHSNLYYTQASPEITDAEYDALFDELKQLSPDHPQLSKVGSHPAPG